LNPAPIFSSVQRSGLLRMFSLDEVAQVKGTFHFNFNFVRDYEGFVCSASREKDAGEYNESY